MRQLKKSASQFLTNPKVPPTVRLRGRIFLPAWADPWLLRVSPLSPHTLATHNVSMFGSSIAVPVERLRNPAGYEFSVITFSKGSGCRVTWFHS